jgi:hypothetical protein
MFTYPWTNLQKELEKRSEEAKNNPESVKCYSVKELREKLLEEYKPSFLEGLWMDIQYKFNRCCWVVYRFFKPCHQRIRKVIPREWCDLTELTLMLNFEIVKSFVEDEMHIIDWSSNDEHKQAAAWLRAAYKYITEERAELLKAIDDAYDNVNHDLEGYYEKYGKVHQAEETLNNRDKEFLIGLAEHRPWLWS